MKFKKGQKVIMEVRGAGVVSKETYTVSEVSKGIVHLEHSSKKFHVNGIESDLSVGYGMFGFRFNIKPKPEPKAKKPKKL